MKPNPIVDGAMLKGYTKKIKPLEISKKALGDNFKSEKCKQKKHTRDFEDLSFEYSILF